MTTPLSRALITLALTILLALAAPSSAQAVKTLPGASAGITQLADPSDVPWGG